MDALLSLNLVRERSYVLERAGESILGAINRACIHFVYKYGKRKQYTKQLRQWNCVEQIFI